MCNIVNSSAGNAAGHNRKVVEMKRVFPSNQRSGVTYFFNGVGYEFINGSWWRV